MNSVLDLFSVRDLDLFSNEPLPDTLLSLSQCCQHYYMYLQVLSGCDVIRIQFRAVSA